jgi:coenzyme F420-dependent glucose-6-phosphate dehydrogenase
LDICFHASHEQFAPSRLLKLASQALESGFQSIHCSDHFHPWNTRQGQSGFAWSWIGASMQKNDCDHGLVCAPGQRYHPVIIAQAVATLLEMFGDRFWISLGTGQALNEAVTDDWPNKSLREDRLIECVTVMRDLWRGETVNHDGLIRARNAKLFTRPEAPPLVLGAAISMPSTRWVAGWADGLITTARHPNELREKVREFENIKGDRQIVYAKVDVAYDQTFEKALNEAFHQWSTNTLGSPRQGEIASLNEFENATKNVIPTDMTESVFVSCDPDEYANLIIDFFHAGATKVIVHNVTTKQEEFLEFWRTEVAPRIKRSS